MSTPLPQIETTNAALAEDLKSIELEHPVGQSSPSQTSDITRSRTSTSGSDTERPTRHFSPDSDMSDRRSDKHRETSGKTASSKTTSKSGSKSSFKSASKSSKDDWSEVVDSEERRRIQNRIAQRKFREKAKEQKESRERAQENQERAGYAYTTPEAEDMGTDDELSGLPWGSLSLKHVVERGKAKEKHSQQASLESTYCAYDSRGGTKGSGSGSGSGRCSDR
ncbi:MAG: hypothetical protein M1818_002462 [Claussenomyces sp. TS43310]|nr:MAG: hypothetical protein M1818_002462 [Claussenomyces sp. TS43310]